MTVRIAPIIEGKTEQQCAEPLLQRIWNNLLARGELLQVLEPTRGNRDALVQRDGRELALRIELAVAKLRAKEKRQPGARSLVLVWLDAELETTDETVEQLEARLLATARESRPDANVACVLAKRMFENWIVAGASTLGGVNGLPASLFVPPDPEACNGSQWLEEQLRLVQRNRGYAKTDDALLFVRQMSLEGARANSPSFAKLCDILQQL